MDMPLPSQRPPRALRRAAARAAAFALLAFLLLARAAHAAPEAKILRIDPRAAQENGDPVLTTLIDIVQSKRVSEATAHCATLRGTAQLDCMSQALERPDALYAAFPFPQENAIFTVTVDGTDRRARFVSEAKWGESQQQPHVGTAWLILVDADRRMGRSFDDARELARRFVASMGPNDLVNVMFFNDRQVVHDSKWLPLAQKAKATGLIDATSETFASQGRNRPLFTIIKGAATDGFKALGNVGEAVQVPLHQAMIVLSSGFGGADPSTTGPAALQLQQYMTHGRFPEDNTALPKAPVPVISVYFPYRALDEVRQNSQEFMLNLANPEIGGFFTVMQEGQGSRSQSIVNAVRTRFSKLHVVKWRVSCVAPSITQTFKLVFNNVKPPILGDNTFKEVPIGIDPTAWPLDVNVKDTQARLKEGVYPGGKFKVYGDFCWDGDVSRVEAYFLPAGQQLPSELTGTDVDQAKRTQQQLIAMGMKGAALQASSTFVELEAPDKDKVLHGAGEQAVVRLILYDNKAQRASGLTADTVVELKGRTPPLPILLILGGAFAVVVVGLLLVIVLRSGGRKRSPAAQPLAPVVGGAAPGMLAAGAAGAPGGVAHPAAPSHASRATLSGAAGAFSVLPGGEIRAGRDPAHCGILLSEPRVSSVHATLKLEGGQLYVKDEHSNNGTTVNGSRLGPGQWAPVPAGAIVRFGPVEFSVRLE